MFLYLHKIQVENDHIQLPWVNIYGVFKNKNIKKNLISFIKILDIYDYSNPNENKTY